MYDLNYWCYRCTSALPYFVPVLYLNHSAGARVSCLAGCRRLVDTPISAVPALQQTSKFLIGFQNSMRVGMQGQSARIVFFFFITMAIWLAVPVWPIWRASGCSAWGEIMMGCLGKNHYQSEAIMQNYVYQSPSTGLNRWETSYGNKNTLVVVHKTTLGSRSCRANLGSSGWMRMNDAWIVALPLCEASCKAWFLQHTHAYSVI